MAEALRKKYEGQIRLWERIASKEGEPFDSEKKRQAKSNIYDTQQKLQLLDHFHALDPNLSERELATQIFKQRSDQMRKEVRESMESGDTQNTVGTTKLTLDPFYAKMKSELLNNPYALAIMGLTLDTDGSIREITENEMQSAAASWAGMRRRSRRNRSSRRRRVRKW